MSRAKEFLNRISEDDIKKKLTGFDFDVSMKRGELFIQDLDSNADWSLNSRQVKEFKEFMKLGPASREDIIEWLETNIK